jgi:hypothetical protein
MSNDSRIGPRYALLAPGWLKWVVVIPAGFIPVGFVAVSVVFLVKGNLLGLAPLPLAAFIAWRSWPSFRAFRDPAASYVELTEEGLVVSPLFSIAGPLSVPYSEIESVQVAINCGWSLFQYPYPLTGSHIDVRLVRVRLIVGYRSFRWARMLHLNVGEPERFLSELSARTGR